VITTSTVTTTPTAPAANQTGTTNVPTLPNVPPTKQKSTCTPRRVMYNKCMSHNKRDKKTGRLVKTHGMSTTKFYYSWKHMVKRCTDKTNKDYYLYGGRGIKICKRWNKFENFKKDMFSSYKKGLTLDRINNERNYKPSNCQWTTRSEQAKNRRTSVIYKGENASDANIRLGGKKSMIRIRIKNGWSIERAFTTPNRNNLCT